ncbi:MAG: oligosaccharide flippase family protein [Bacteroidota bacterium]
MSDSATPQKPTSEKPSASSEADAQTAHQAGVLAVGQILATLIETIAPLVIVRILGKADVGVLTALLLINTTLTMVLTVGLPGTLAFHLPGRASGERRTIVVKMGLLLLALGGGVALCQLTIAGLSWSGVLDTEVKLYYLVALVGLPLGDLPMRMLPNMLIVEGRDRAAASTSIIRSLGMSLGTLIPLALGADVWTVMLVLSGLGVVYLVLTFAYSAFVYRGVAPTPTSMTTGGLIRFAVPIGLTELVSNINNRFDRFLIIPLGAVALAEYNAGSWQVPVVPSLAYAVGVAYGPRFATLFKENRLRDAVALWREQAKKTALLVVPLCLVFVVAAEETVTLLFTADYLDGASVLRLYALMTMGRITAFGTILVAAGRPAFVLRSALIAFGANVVISVPLVMLIGFNGPALGTLLAFVVMVAGYTWHIGRVADVPFRQVFPLGAWLRVVLTALPAVALAAAFKLFVETGPVLGLAGQAAIILVGYAITATLTGLVSAEEWRFLRRYLLLRLNRDAS